MSDEQAFLRAVFANPAETALRLVYADWLEERGDPRGAYLRLLCTAADPTGNAVERDTAVARLEELRPTLDPRWVALMHRGCRPVQPAREPERRRQRGRADRRTRGEAEVLLFLRQYARKAERGPYRSYDRGLERRVLRMKPEDLDRLMRGDD